MKQEINYNELERIVSSISEFIMKTDLTKEQQDDLNVAIDYILKLEE